MGTNSAPSIRYDIGDRAWKYGFGVATLSYLPLSDRAGYVKRIRVTSPSAADTWVVSVSGKEIHRFVVDTAGNQHFLGIVGLTNIATEDIFSYVHQTVKRDMSYPVPKGQTLTVASVGGATASVAIQYEEHVDTSVTGTEINGASSTHFLAPFAMYVATAQTAAGLAPIDTRIAVISMPNFILPTSPGTRAVFPEGWKGKILALFTDPVGINSYSGAADHKSATQYLQVIRNEQPLFTREATGIPMLGTPSASGSANSVFQSGVGDLPPFDRALGHTRNLLDYPIETNGGDTFSWSIGVAGDFTGNPSYAHSYVMGLYEYWRV